MWRRFVIFAVVCLLAAALPRSAAAAQIPLITVILPKGSARHQAIHSVFMQRFAAVSASLGKPKIYVQSPNSDIMSLRNSIRKAVAIGSDLIVVYGTRAAMAAQQEDFTEPLLFVDVFDPVSLKLVPSYKRGATLVTGVCGYPPVQTLLKVLHETLGTIRLGVPMELRSQTAKAEIEVLRKAACRPGSQDARPRGGGGGKPPGELCSLEIVATEMSTPASLQQNLKATAGKVDALYLSDLMPSDEYLAEALAFAANARIPVVTQVAGLAEQGALFVLEADPAEQGEALSEIVQRVLVGELPEDIPPVVPHKVSLVINLATAQQLGIQVPFPILTQAGRVVR